MTGGIAQARGAHRGGSPTHYGWHNGITEAEPQSLGQTLLNIEILSIDQAIDQWRWLRPCPEPWQWNPTWLPFGSSSGMWRYAADCTPPQGAVATVRFASPDEGYFDEKNRPSVSGFATVVGWWLDALGKAWIRWAPDPGEWQDPGRAPLPGEWGISGWV